VLTDHRDVARHLVNLVVWLDFHSKSHLILNKGENMPNDKAVEEPITVITTEEEGYFEFCMEWAV
jgi:hypothetical protein